MIANPTVHDAPRPRHAYGVLIAGVVVVFLLLILADLGLIGVTSLLRRRELEYDGRIHPNVRVQGVDVGGLTPEQASDILRAVPEPGTAGTLTLTDGRRRWAVAVADLGVRRDLEATVQAALAVGRGQQDMLARMMVWVEPKEVPPVLTIDPEAGRAALQQLAGQVAIPAGEATFRLQGGRVVAVTGQPGRSLDVEATLGDMAAAIATQNPQPVVEVSLVTVMPRVADAAALVPQAQEYLKRQVRVTAYDPISDERLAWTLGGEAIVAWLRAEPAPDGTARGLRVDVQAIGDTLAGLAAGLAQGRGLGLDDASARVLAALEAGGGDVTVRVTHPERQHAVRAGDVLDGIAYRYGMPPAVLAEANPGVDPNLLRVGQQLVIPSVDVLLPHPPVPNKRIVISIGEQRMRVYENGERKWDWPVSTGIASSPTLPGTFQVLEKDEKAYASRWDLWMPHFLAVYQAGPGFYNGIHALPILSGGGRLWEGLLGRPASYGCIILGIQQAETLYQWAEVGVTVVIEPR